MDYLQRLAQYFRCSILDTERLSPDLKSLEAAIKAPQFSTIKPQDVFSVSASVWSTGVLPLEATTGIFTALKVAKKAQEVKVVLIPRVDLRQRHYASFVGSGSPIITPLILELYLNREGTLKPTRVAPYVPREWLMPNEKDETAFAKVAIFDAFLSLNPFNVTSWAELVNYCQRMMLALANDNPHAGLVDDQQTLWDVPLLEGYLPRLELSLMMLEPKIRAGFHILKIYDALIRGAKPNKLFARLLSKHPIISQDYQDLSYSSVCSSSHLAQMTGEFPLATKQRNALHHIEKMKLGDVLAVNGPPGTGKTTLLRSVIANAWVRAAYEKSEPPITYVSSSSNQAVTNVLDSFSRIDESGLEEALKGRWLPVINTYGLYGVGNSAATENAPYPYMTKNGDGLMQVMQTIPINELLTCYSQAFACWMPTKEPLELDDMIDQLHQALIDNAKAQHQLPKQLKAFQRVKQQLKDGFESLQALEQEIVFCNEVAAGCDTKEQVLEKALMQFLLSWQQRSFWQSLFSFLPMIKRRWHLDNELLARQLKLNFKEVFSDHNVRESIALSKQNLYEESAHNRTKLKDLTDFLASYLSAKKSLSESLLNAKIDGDIETLSLTDLLNRLDTSLRFEAFKLASHYWEGCWLRDVQNHPTGFDKPRNKEARLQEYRRFAKLTPCFVSTFNMLPNFMEVSRKDGDSWLSDPIADGIDLLIIDEAGQALPHVAAASFALAKKAVLVGDVYQIEPVWTLPKGIDIANLQHCGLLKTEEDYSSFWLASNMLAGSGNLMKLAHRQTPQTQFPDLEPGFYLTEHRRCYDNIIQYCNHLVYKGNLEAMRGLPEVSTWLPSLSFVHHDSESQVKGQSRVNQAEAEVIVNWMMAHAKPLCGNDSIEKCIAIITPFNRQAQVIRSELNKTPFANIKVGTVNTFQGAEADIVLFSSVYGINDGAGTKYYDRGPNMLNVAVSRAKNTLIVFGHEKIFGRGGSTTPSALLRAHLQWINKKTVSEDIISP